MIRFFLLGLVLLGTTGCAMLGKGGEMTADGGTGSGTPAAGTGWWYARFSIARPEDEPPRWYVDSLLGGEVIAPVFERQHADILIWRVHRRAGNDSAGHVFSFIFYATATGAQRVYAALEDNAVLRDLRRDGVVTAVTFDDLTRITRPNVEDTSDRHWSLPLQQTWPAFAMGVSRMWLDLVGEMADRHAGEPDLETRYRAVQADVTDIWAGEGQHALLHHLSALFAYQPLFITY